MKRQQAEAVLNRFFEESGRAVPAQSDIEPVLDRVREQLGERADEFVSAGMPAESARPFRFAWAAAVVLLAVSANVLVWLHGPPFSVSVKTESYDQSLWKTSPQAAGQTLQLTVPQDAFELASVKVLDPSSEAANTAKRLDNLQLQMTGCAGGYVPRGRVDPGRLTLPSVTVLSLVIVAYGQDCSLVEGAPTWARAGGDYYDIQGLLPAGSPIYTTQDLAKGNAPVLQRMLQNLLADRFRLVVKRELREMPVYTLTIATPGKLKLSPDETLPPPAIPSPPGFPTPPSVGRGQKLQFMLSGEVTLTGHAISISELAKDLRQHAGRVVVDQTGWSGPIDYNLKFAGATPATVAGPPPSPQPTTGQSIPPLPGVPTAPASPMPSLSNAMEEQLGLKLEAARMPIEVLVIQSVERPAEN